MRFVVTGGGTGGHLFPGIAVAEAMKARFPDAEIMFIGTSRSMDQQILAKVEMETAQLRCSGLKGASIGARVKSLAELPGAILHARTLLKDFKADLVLGVGGYVTGPVLAAARSMGIPSCIHEQNSVPGLANRLAGKIVDRIFTSIPCASVFPHAKVAQTGNPVRKEIVEVSGSKPKSKQFTVLVLGGSQGAHRVNTLMMEVAAALDGDHENLVLVHQTGARDCELVQEAYQKLTMKTTVSAFISDMATAYQQADLVVSRAGATTLAELAVMGLPALLIPYPFAADDHQQRNAEYYAASGGSKVFPEKDLSAVQLSQEIGRFMSEPGLLTTMGEQMRKLALPNAAESIVDHCVELAS